MNKNMKKNKDKPMIFYDFLQLPYDFPVISYELPTIHMVNPWKILFLNTNFSRQITLPRQVTGKASGRFINH